MSQAGGPNSAGSVNIDFTGNVAPLEQAAKKAEAAVQQSAAKMQAAVTAARSPAGDPAAALWAAKENAKYSFLDPLDIEKRKADAARAAEEIARAAERSYMPGQNFGPMYNAATTQIDQANQKQARGFKGLIRPINDLLGAYSRLIGIGSLIGGMAASVVWAFNYKAQTAKKLKEDIDSLRESTKATFDQFDDGSTGGETALARYEERGKRLEETFQNAVDAAKALNDGTGPGARLSSAGITAAENAAFRARERLERAFIREKNQEETDSLIKFTKSQKEAADERAKYVAALLGGEAEEYIKAQIEIRKAQETIDADLLDAKIANIERERDEKIKAMAEADKKIYDNAIEQERRLDRERRRLMADFYRDLRAQQTQGTEVSGFAAGNLSQSLDLLNRQRSAVEGMSINYGGD